MERLHSDDVQSTEISQLDTLLLQLTEKDRNGLSLLGTLCDIVEADPIWSEADKTTLFEAIELADVAHEGQARGYDEYFGHPVRVAIRVYARGATPEQVIAALLHDTVEDNPMAVIRYLWSEAEELPPTIGQTRHERIDLAIALLYDSKLFGSTAPYVDHVTNRPYPSEVDVTNNDAKHRHRAAHVRKLGEDPHLLLLKDCDTYDNVVMLPHHEALHGDIAALDNLVKLLDKYTVVLNELEQLAREGNVAVNLHDCMVRRTVIDDVRNRVEALSSTVVKAQET